MLIGKTSLVGPKTKAYFSIGVLGIFLARSSGIAFTLAVLQSKFTMTRAFEFSFAILSVIV